MSFDVRKDIEALVQECLALHEKHLELSGDEHYSSRKSEIRTLAKESSTKLQGTLHDLLTYRHAEKTMSNRHQGFGWSSEIIRERFTACVQKEVESIYAKLR
jgi:hypothetical protein